MAWGRTITHIGPSVKANLQEGALDLVSELARYIPSASVVDKRHCSAFRGLGFASEACGAVRGHLDHHRRKRMCACLQRLCTRSTLPFGCSSVRHSVCCFSDEGHDALRKVFHGRYTHQIETASGRMYSPRGHPEYCPRTMVASLVWLRLPFQQQPSLPIHARNQAHV